MRQIELAINKCICFLFIWIQNKKRFLHFMEGNGCTAKNCQVEEGDYTYAGASNDNERENGILVLNKLLWAIL